MKKRSQPKEKYISLLQKNIFVTLFLTIFTVCLVIYAWNYLSKGNVLGTSTASPITSIDTTVSVQTSQVAAILPSRFLGFSFETNSLCNLVGTWDTPLFERLIKNIGPQVIRIGGNTADYALWNPTGSYECVSGKTVLTRQLIDAFFSLAYRINTKVMWTLNLGNYAPSTYSDEANYIMNKGAEIGKTTGDFLWAIGMGNEPDLYKGNGLRSTTYSVSDYIHEWNAYKDTVRKISNHPTRKFMGPDIADNDTWFSTFLTDESGVLSRATHHFYALHKNRIPAGTTTQQLIEMLLSRSIMQQTASTIDSWRQTTKQVPLVIGETNSITGGGYAGVSNTFASTLWGIDYMFTALEHGTVQLNFHTGGQSAYTPLAFANNGQVSPRPLYYAMLLFRYAAPAGSSVATNISSPYNVAAHSIMVNGNLRVVVINKDLTHNANVEINADRSYRSAGAVYLTAPTINATTNITFGGSSINADGTWRGKGQIVPLANNGQTARVAVPAASAVVILFNNQ